MPNVLRQTWKANRHWVAAGFLLSTVLFLLFMYFSVFDSFRGFAEDKNTALAALANSPASLFVPGLRRGALHEIAETRARSRDEILTASEPMAFVGGVPGGVVGGVMADAEAKAQRSDRQVVRTGTLNIVAADPVSAAQQVAGIAGRLGGFVVNSTIKGDERLHSAAVQVRIPADRFDEARAEIRRLAKNVEEDSVQAQDVTRRVLDSGSSLRNARAEEEQYLSLLKRAGSMKDVLAVTEKLADVRGRIEQDETDLTYLQHTVEMSLLSVQISPVPTVEKPGVHWRPLLTARMSMISALDAAGDFADSVLSLLLYLPVIAAWLLLLFAILKVGWWTLVRLARVFFPALPVWRKVEQG